MLLATGMVIEIALMPIVLFHFHRAGLYGAFANVIAIPLVTFICMPMIALALLLDPLGLGMPFWWVAQQSLELLLWIAHFTAAQPGSVKLVPEMGGAALACFVAGGLWLALWQGKARLLGFVAAAVGLILVVLAKPPDILISGDGRNVGVAGEGERLLVLREGRSDYAKENLLERAGLDGEPIALEGWEGAECSPDFCVLALDRDGQTWQILMARSRARVEERSLAAACELSDIVIADRWLPASCNPRWLKADRRLLSETGGMAVYLGEGRTDTVADGQGQHGWWRGGRD